VTIARGIEENPIALTVMDEGENRMNPSHFLWLGKRENGIRLPVGSVNVTQTVAASRC